MHASQEKISEVYCYAHRGEHYIFYFYIIEQSKCENSVKYWQILYISKNYIAYIEITCYILPNIIYIKIYNIRSFTKSKYF